MTQSQRPARTASKACGWILTYCGGAIFVAWLLGVALSDRWAWSQWLLWMTDLSLVPAAALIMAGRLVRGRRGISPYVLVMVLGPVFWAASLWGWGWLKWTNESTTDTIRVLQWSAGPVIGDPTPYANFITSIDADVSIVHGAHRAAPTDTFRAWSHQQRVFIRGAFLIASHIPITRLQTIGWADDITLVYLELLPPQAEPLRMILVDLPSDPARSRNAIVSRAKHMLKERQAEADVMLGDFNLTQGSWQLRNLMPPLEPVWFDTGHGWGGTYPRNVPVLQLDHVLAMPDRVQSIHVVTPPIGRHRAMVSDIKVLKQIE